VGSGTAPESSDEQESAPAPTLVFLPEGQSFAEVFGVDPAAVDGRSVEPGETFDVQSLTVASVGNALFSWEFPDGYEVLFRDGRPAALGGAVFDLAVLATPSASIAGVEANPIVSMDSETLLTDDTTRTLLSNTGFSDADNVRWIDGPKRLSREGSLALDAAIANNAPESLKPSEPSLIGEPTTIETYAGVVSGRNGPWAVGVHVVRATPNDHVMAIGTQRAPLESVGGVSNEEEAESLTPFPIISWKNWYLDARAMMQVVVPRLTNQRDQ
jgi:hypothetical protein